MDWQRDMNRAIGYIEEHLDGDIDPSEAARLAGCSLWEFQRVFSFLSHMSLGEYIRVRRLACAAQELAAGGIKVIDVAIKYGYESPAAFSRAFAQVYGVTPSSVRGMAVPIATHPRIAFPMDERGPTHMAQRNPMEAFSERGYYVRENAPVYFTKDMDRTCKWFKDVLGWYGDIVARDEDGRGTYGCVFDYPGELIVANLTPFRGVHLFEGAPSAGVVAFMLVQGLDRLHALVKANGWDGITAIEEQPWGARECRMTTVDGSVIRFFETTA